MLADQIRELSADEIAERLTVLSASMIGMKQRHKREMAALMVERDLIDDELQARYGDLIKHAASQKPEPCGTVKVPLNNYMLKAEIPKKVSWNADALYPVAQKVLPDEFRALFGAGISVLETGYRRVSDDDLKAMLDDARTVTYGDPTITLEMLQASDFDDEDMI